MTRKWHELEFLILAAYAAIPMYLSDTLRVPMTAVYHLAIGGLMLLVWSGRRPAMSPMAANVLSIFFLLLFPFDALRLSGSLIHASIHLVYFIVLTQALVQSNAERHAQRLVVVFLLFVAGIASWTSLAVIAYVVGFFLLAVRQLIVLSHMTTLRDADGVWETAPTGRSAFTYLVPATILAVILFPALPRIHNPMFEGMTPKIPAGGGGISERINFNEDRSADAGGVVARVWMPYDALAIFSPLRLRGAVYDRWYDGDWSAATSVARPVDRIGESFYVGNPGGFSRTVTIEQRRLSDGRLYLPVGTHIVKGVDRLIEQPTRSVFSVPYNRDQQTFTYDAVVSMSWRSRHDDLPTPLGYPITDEVRQLAIEIAAGEERPLHLARRIETHLAGEFEYEQIDQALGRSMSVDEFLLTERKGHCEYFAAGMVVLLNALDVPARMVAGFYGGSMNPLTGYLTVRGSDAHAWVEVYEGGTWHTLDPTPAALRPGNQGAGLLALLANLADSIKFFWDRYVLTFSLADQVRLLAEGLMSAGNSWARLKSEIAGTLTSHWFRQQLLAAAGLFALIAGGIFWWNRRQRSTFVIMLGQLRSAGIEVGPSTAPLELLHDVEVRRPELASSVRPVIDVYLRERFSPDPPTPDARAAARRALDELRRKIRG
jgi:protein-glutamine gamma-glutamyltransferase